MIMRGLEFVRSNAVALLALFVALGGTGYAASGGFTSGGKLQACVSRNGQLTLLRSGKSCRHGQQKVVWNQTGPRGAAGPAGTSGLNGAAGTSGTITAKVTSAETALTANNALALGGTPAGEFTHRDCASLTGQVKGFAKIPENFKSATFVPVAPSYNCSGQPVEAMSTTPGVITVRFLGSPATIALATASNDKGELFEASAMVSFIKPGEWDVEVQEKGGPIGEGVVLMVP